MPRSINKKNFETAVLKHNQPVVVDVWAAWCGPCKMLAPQFAAAEKAMEGKVRFVKLDADKNQKITKKYKVMALPSLLYFNDGKLVDRSSGVVSKDNIVKRLKPLISEEDRKQLKGGFNWRFWE